MAIIFQEFLNANEGRNYPLHDAATRLSTGGTLLPNSLLVDANIWMPQSAGNYIFLSSAAVTNSLVTLTFSAASDSPICGTPSSTFVPLAVLSLTKPVARFKNYAITPFLSGVGGWVMLGKAAIDSEIFSLIFDDPKAGLLLDRVVRVYQPSAVPTIGKVGVTPPLQGLVSLQGLGGGVVTKGAVRNINGVDRIVGLIGLNLGSSPVNTLTNFSGICGHRPSANDCNTTPIISINGIKPDCNGNINMAFEGPVVVGDMENGLVLDSIQGLGDVCKQEQYAPPVTGDACSFIVMGPINETACAGFNVTFSVAVSGKNPHYQWARSTDGGTTWVSILGANSSSYKFIAHLSDNGNLYKVFVSKINDWTTPDTVESGTAKLTVESCSSLSSSSSFTSKSSESLGPIGGKYCETFTGGLANEFSITKGNFSIEGITYFAPVFDSGFRYRSASGYMQAEQVAIDFDRRMSALTSYRLSAKIRPRDAGNGHLIFGYTGPDNFFALGVLIGNEYYPDGAFYIAQRVANPTAGGGALGLGDPGSKYEFLPGAVFSNPDAIHPFQDNDYFVNAEIFRMAGFAVVNFEAHWVNYDGSLGTMTQSYPVPAPPSGLAIWQAANDVAYCGLGVFSSVTDFGDFGINCQEIMSSSMNACESCVEFGDGMGDTSFIYGTGHLSMEGFLVSDSAMALSRNTCAVGLYSVGSKYRINTDMAPIVGDVGSGIIFAMTDDLLRTGNGTMWQAGIVPTAVTGSPYGLFYISQNSVSGGVVSSPTVYTYQPWFGGPLHQVLPNIDYQMEVTVERTVSGATITLHITWTDSGPQEIYLQHTSATIGEGDGYNSLPQGTAPGIFAGQAGVLYSELCAYQE